MAMNHELAARIRTMVRSYRAERNEPALSALRFAESEDEECLIGDAGKTFSGFEKALAKLPMPVLRTLADALRGRLEEVFGERLFYGGWIPLGCDGTRLECPRSEELERRVGHGGKENSAPTIGNTSIVHLTLGIP